MKVFALTLLRRLVRILTRTETSLAEFWGSTMLLAMGTWLCLPFRTFESIPAYHAMSHLLPEVAWGVIAVVLGIVQSAGSLLNVRRFRMAAAGIAAAIFGFVANLALLSEPASLLFPICGTAAFVESTIWLRLSILNAEAPGGVP